MRIINNATGQEFYLSRIKGNVQPKYTLRVRPIQITISNSEYDVFCNSRRSQYAYINLMPLDGSWYACRDLSILNCEKDPFVFIDFGRPFKPRGENK